MLSNKGSHSSTLPHAPALVLNCLPVWDLHCCKQLQIHKKPDVPQCVRRAVSSHTATLTHALVGTAHQHPQSGCSCVQMWMYSPSVGSQSQCTSHRPDGLGQPPG